MPYSTLSTKATSRDDLFKQTSPNDARDSKRIIHSSIPNSTFTESHVTSSNNGFVVMAWEAYSSHHHLSIRPDDIWFAILSQLSFYINKNAENLRQYFVNHEGQKELMIEEFGNIDTIDMGLFARRMTGKVQENVKDPNFRDWIMPTFSTTTVDDRSTAAVLMMGSLQAYFRYKFKCMCGIPSVTLLGEQSDYEDILQRLDKLKELGPETADWASLLRPVLRNFIASFAEVMTAETKSFWSRIAHHEGGSGVSKLSGWLTAFCFWGHDGVSLYYKPVSYRPFTIASPPFSLDPTTYTPNLAANVRSPGTVLDGVTYHTIDTDDIPNGFASVPVLVDDNGTQYRTKMVAGSLGIKAQYSGDMDEDGGKKLDSLSSLTGWIMYEVKDDVGDK
ncbi:uncharacterized protein N0V89_001638 [Didymosphaeria variabile]|uniref:DUF4419 domain-containing protein n=1 Tax=Didymosphaeria variabile TaxID=1932322 RepID=A0A9W9CGV3_9PLEO|nr:uncharacterized protein N0V89_001638 [Didymosphaeria variabile]KAJ4361069.1 hypothetical protein N0V89_001638 [Didymosphaeria variabile]